MLLSDKVAIITGAARGTGATTAERFVAQGASVVVTDVLDREGGDTAARIGGEFCHLDVTDESNWAQVVDHVVAKYGRVDVLVNNAAILHIGTIEHTPLDLFRRILDVNTAGAFAGIRAVIGPMKATGGGAIVNVSSIDGEAGMNGVTAYSASKFGMRGLAKSAAVELGRYSIRVNSVLPAGGNPMMFAKWGAELAKMDITSYVNDRAMPRTAATDEIADAIVFLASDLARFVTGADLPVDGGKLAGHFIAGFNEL